MLKYGRQPALNPSMQGFKHIKNLLNKTLPSSVTSVSISTTLPGDLFSTSALKLYNILNVFAQSPYNDFMALCFAFHTVVYCSWMGYNFSKSTLSLFAVVFGVLAQIGVIFSVTQSCDVIFETLCEVVIHVCWCGI